MGDLGNFGDLGDFVNARQSWLSSQGKSHRAITFHKFQDYNTQKNTNPNEQFRQKLYASKNTHVWLSFVKVFDTIKQGYFTTGDIDVASEFPLRGFLAAYTLPDATNISEYGGDLITWNGSVWEVADVLEPIQFGYLYKQTWYHTVMRRTNLSGVGVAVGP